MKVKVIKIGNSKGIIIPSVILKSFGDVDEFEIIQDKNEIILSKEETVGTYFPVKVNKK